VVDSTRWGRSGVWLARIGAGPSGRPSRSGRPGGRGGVVPSGPDTWGHVSARVNWAVPTVGEQDPTKVERHPSCCCPVSISPPLSSLAQAETSCRPPTPSQPSLGLPIGRDASADGQHTRHQGKKHRDVRHGADLPLLGSLLVPPAARHRTAHRRPPQCDFLRSSRQRHQIPPHSPSHTHAVNQMRIAC
jgi:hypothetical protein